MNEEERNELIAAYALGALDDDDHRRVSQLLDNDPALRTQLHEYQDSLLGLTSLVPARKAPPHLKENFRQRLQAEIQMEAENTRPAPSTRPDQPPAPTVPFPTNPRRTNNQQARILLAGLAALLIVAIGVAAIFVNRVSNDPATAIFNDPAAVRVQLVAGSGVAAGNIQFVVRRGENQGVLVAQLVAPQADKDYQLWFIKDSKVIPSQVLKIDGQKMLVEIPNGYQDYTLGVTVEPKGGSKEPTTSPIYLGKIPQG